MAYDRAWPSRMPAGRRVELEQVGIVQTTKAADEGDARPEPTFTAERLPGRGRQCDPEVPGRRVGRRGGALLQRQEG